MPSFPPWWPSVAPSPVWHHISKGERWLMRAIRQLGISSLIRLLMHLSCFNTHWESKAGGREWGGVHPPSFQKISTCTKIFTLYINLWEINLPLYFLPPFLFFKRVVWFPLPTIHAQWAFSILIHSWDYLQINVPEEAVFGQSGWILSSTTEALLRRVSWSGGKESKE